MNPLLLISSFVLLLSPIFFGFDKDAISMSFLTAPVLPIIILIESLIFWAFTSHSGIPYWKILLLTFAANFVTAVLCIFVPVFPEFKNNYFWIGIAFILAIGIEWLVYISYFTKANVGKTKLFVISSIGNILTIAALITYIFYKL